MTLVKLVEKYHYKKLLSVAIMMYVIIEILKLKHTVC